MSAEWPRVQISEVCDLIVDCVNKTAPQVGYETPYKMIRTPNIKNGRIDLAGCRFVEKDTYEKWTRRATVELGDVLLTREAPMGEVGIVDFDDTIFLGQRVMQYRANPEVLDSQFLLYAFLSPDLQYQFRMHDGSGSVVSHIRVPDCSKFEINLPSLEVQKEIAKILSNLDNKIQLNRQTNQTLEQIAQAIFKSWFVHFEPVKAKVIVKEKGGSQLAQSLAAQAMLCGAITLEQLTALENDYRGLEAQLHPLITQRFPDQHGLDYWSPEQLQATAELFPDALVESGLGEVPEGWGLTILGELIEFNPKRVLKKGTIAPYLDMKNVPTQGHLADDVYDREMGSGTKFINGDTLLARITPCLENGKTAYVDFMEENQVGWGSTEYIVMRPKGERPLSLAYVLARIDSFRKKAIQTMTGTSGRQRANAKVLADQLWLDYPVELLIVFDSIAGAYLSQAKINGDQNKTLAELRDTLLPKLLSGEVDLSFSNEESREATR